MTNAESPAFPQPEMHDAGQCQGLTKREYFAAVAMQGLVANSSFWSLDFRKEEVSQGLPVGTLIQRIAIHHADLMIAQLEQTKPKP